MYTLITYFVTPFYIFWKYPKYYFYQFFINLFEIYMMHGYKLKN
jgi:hypothetical protein